MKIFFRCILLVSIVSCSTTPDDHWRPLLDKNLTQWETYLSYQHKVDYKGSIPVDDQGNAVVPVGIVKNNSQVFTMVEENGESILHVTGEVYGCLYTKQEFKNYHLKLQVKWGEQKHVPRTDKLKDSGLLYHSIGEPGVDYWRVWMLSQEFQIMEGHMGDYWNIASSAIDIRAYQHEGNMNSIASEQQSFLPFGTGAAQGFCLRSENHERSVGEWNTLELICFEDKSLHIVNGHVVMVLKNSRYIKDGKTSALTQGKIQLQSEAAEVYFKDIQIRPLTELPPSYSTLFH
jgi:hypothetical protein